MSLFQTSVVKKYLNELSSELIDKKYKQFQEYFGNPEIQQNIRDSKEEEYQSGFVRALFVNILGYTLKPEPNFNLVLEKKNVDDSKKADGAILKDNEVIAVIELKSTQTTDLDTVETQAFGYKNHNPKCQYIITSNFEKIRLYIQNAINHVEFDLFNLSREDFALLCLCFLKDNILKDIPLKIKESSVLQEENVTKKLYNDYSKFRTEIFENIVKNNPDFDKLILFKKTQKLLDRFLFIFFAEDRLLLPPNSISEIVKQWITLKEDLDEYVPLYERFKKYFGYINNGFKGKKYDIFAYNGGLFLPDEILDNIKIDDEVLHQNTVQLSTYDFETDVDVNILGHIFEHSLNEIENVQAEIAGEEIDTQKTKRKKDGIFYTPKYITKYIVENTVGKLCEEKRIELGIIDEEYAKGRKNRKKDIVRALDEKLTQYRDWLLKITILDPACGSGAFLNQALEFLLQEHKKIDDLKFQLLGGSIVFSDIEAKILENNIFGVDLNEESVEIAKLSLWLRTAQKGRKLTALSNHVKCGNSLIDDPEIAGDKAFNWKNEFPEVFANGGFDVIIGNPPYVSYQSNLLKQFEIDYFSNNYLSSYKIYDLYGLFIEKANSLLRLNSKFSFICPSTLLMNDSFSKLRTYISENYNINEFVFCSDGVFKDAVVPTIIFIFSKSNFKNESINILTAEDLSINLKKTFDYNFFTREPVSGFNIDLDVDKLKIINKAYSNSIKLGEILQIRETIKTGDDKFFISDEKINEEYYPLVTGKDVSRYSINQKKFLLYDIAKLSRPTKLEYFEKPKLFIRRVGSKIECAIDNKKYLSTHVLYIGIPIDSNFKLEYLLALLNSTLFTKLYHWKFPPKGKVFPEIRIGNLRELPIKNIDKTEQQNISSKAEQISVLTNDLVNISSKFLRNIQRRFDVHAFSKKMNLWYSLDFKTFIKELSKIDIKLTISEEATLEEYFLEECSLAQGINNQIIQLDKEIDNEVFELYQLNDNDITLINKE